MSDLGRAVSLQLVSALLTRVKLSTSGFASIDSVEAAAIRELLDGAEGCESLPAFRNAAVRVEDAGTGLCPSAASVPTSEPLRVDSQDCSGPLRVGCGTSPDRDFEIDWSSFNEESPSDPILCVDFGTAMTKAFARSVKGKTFELAIGRIADGDHPFMVESSIWIDEGQIFFGPEAVRRSEESTGTKRLDSMKSFIFALASGERDLYSPLGSDLNPHAGEFDFSCLGLLTLYLAYVERLIGRSLEEHRLPTRLKRRLARPCWTGEAGDRASEVLKGLVARSLIAADSLGDDLLEGLPIEYACRLLDTIDGEVSEADIATIVQNTVHGDLAEPEAVAAPYEEENDVHYMTVVDVGAGTSDVATFRLRFDRDRAEAEIRLVPNSSHSSTFAGDYVDRCLLDDLMEQFGGLSSEQLEAARVRIGHRIREYKQSLFEEGTLEVEEFDITVELTKDDFFELESMSAFGTAMDDLLSEAFRDIPYVHANTMNEKGGVRMLFTGGGANLPMVKSLAGPRYRSGNFMIHSREIEISPQWLIQRSEDFQQVYPQLAVAIGGTTPNLPRRKSA